MTVSEAQIEAGRNAVEKLMRANLGKRVTVEQQLEVIYLAMKAAEPLPQGDVLAMIDERIARLPPPHDRTEYAQAKYGALIELRTAITAIGSQSIEGERRDG